MTHCSRRPHMRWSEATGGIGRCKRVSTGYARQSGSGRVWRSTCGEKRKPKDVTRHSKPCMRRVQDENHPASLLQSHLGAFFRRMRSKLGPAKATTATAHTLAKIIYHMLKEKTSYRERGADYYMHKDQERKLRQLRKQAKHLGFDVVPQASH